MRYGTRFGLMALAAALSLAWAGPPAQADWVLGDGHKMHFPQLPDPNGWDVDITRRSVADDWQCSSTGPVGDIHFWYSWQGGSVGDIDQVQVRIWDDDRSGPFSKPGNLLWDRLFDSSQFLTRLDGQGDQGWYTPGANVTQNDHTEYYQLNITDIADPFVQQVGEIYWLELHISPLTGFVGWKTTQNHFEDKAVWDNQGVWEELIDPIDGQPLDMAFVITPEPATLGLMAMGLIALARRRR